MKIRCKHLWKLIDKTILESPMTKLINASQKATFSGATPDFYQDKVILTFLCEICGEYSIEERPEI